MTDWTYIKLGRPRAHVRCAARGDLCCCWPARCHRPHGKRVRGSRHEAERWLDDDYNAGLLMEANRLLAIDIDDDTSPNDFPSTLTVRTGRGYHLIYATDQVFQNIPIRTGLDVRSQGTYITAPGSLHATADRRYEVVRGGLPTVLPPGVSSRLTSL